jgi:hypothetical protein
MKGGTMSSDRERTLKWQRCEAKYLVSEAQAAEILRYCRHHLSPDPHASSEAGFVYPVLNIYLDSASRVLLQHTIQKQVNRYKLRVRTYRDRNAPTNGLPEYFEIKRRVGGVVHKARARLCAQDADNLLWGDTELFSGECNYDRAAPANRYEFQQLRRRIRAQPVVGVSYTREAYEGISAERVRVTLDRDLHYGILARPDAGGRDMWWPINPGGVILEIKFTNVYPFWVMNMLHRVEVVRSGVCKYVICSRGAGIATNATLVGGCAEYGSA